MDAIVQRLNENCNNRNDANFCYWLPYDVLESREYCWQGIKNIRIMCPSCRSILGTNEKNIKLERKRQDRQKIEDIYNRLGELEKQMKELIIEMKKK